MIRGNSMMEMYGDGGGFAPRRPRPVSGMNPVGRAGGRAPGPPTFTGMDAANLMGGGFTPGQPMTGGGGYSPPMEGMGAGGSAPLDGLGSFEAAQGPGMGSLGQPQQPFPGIDRASIFDQGRAGNPGMVDPNWMPQRPQFDSYAMGQQGADQMGWGRHRRGGGDQGGALQSMYGRPFTNGY